MRKFKTPYLLWIAVLALAMVHTSANTTIAGRRPYVKAYDFIPIAYLYGNYGTVVAKVDNAVNDHVAYCSFEDTYSGNWSVTASAVQTEAGKSALTGKAFYNLAVTGITKTFSATPNKNFIVSYWSRSGQQSVIGTSSVTTGRSVVVDGYTWVYYEHYLVNPTMVIVSGFGIIDELRLYPEDARMTTYTYLPTVGVSSVCNINNQVTYYEYDAFNRLLAVRDQDRNIVKTYEYNYKQ